MRNISNYFEFWPVVKEKMPFKGTHIFKSGGLFVLRSKSVPAILVDGIMRNFSV